MIRSSVSPSPEDVDHAERHPPPQPQPEAPDLHAEAQRWVRRKRILYSIIGVYLALSVMWFAIDVADGTESLWFYWPMLGVGTAVAVVAIVLFGMGGLFGVSWERRQVEHYVRDRSGPRDAPW